VPPADLPRTDFLSGFFAAEMAEHRAVAEATAHGLGADFVRLAEICARASHAGGKLFFFGNGGSASDAMHIATEFSVRYRKDRRAIPALALTSDGVALTAIGNDFGFEHVFARQLEAQGRAGDVAIGISTSGKSKNVLLALSRARDLGMTAAGFSGGDGGQMHGLADPLLVAPSWTVARIQEMHITLGQMLCGAIEIALGLAPETPKP
jgi:D-sedoheptulose 7-phosphate isomerase